MNYPEAVSYLMSFVDHEKTPGLKYQDPGYSLDGFRAFLGELGNPQNVCKAILVAGTKGKGSTAALIESALRAQGLHTGLYTSPHLVSFCERIKIDGKSILERDFAQRLEWLKPFLDRHRPGSVSGQATVFEILTAMAFLYFQEMGVEWAVLEVGLGGRLDCTNVANPRVSVITNISLDHTDTLGDSISEIAKEKAGIIRQDGLVVSAPQATEAARVLMTTVQKLNARLFQVGRDVGFRITRQTPQQVTLDVAGTFGTIKNIEVGLAGEFQAENAATAFGALRALQFRNQQVDEDAIRRGFAQVVWPGRLQVVSQSPLVILDGAHNDYSAYRLKRSLDTIYPDRSRIVILGISANKDIAGIVQNLVPESRAVIVTRARHSRAADPQAIRQEVSRLGIAALAADSLAQALDRARELASDHDLILVTGSLFLVGEALEMIGRKI
jgi:dihydrofolate synthase/folylpolyglutamate synthase